MPADAPTILATSGGIGAWQRTRFTFTALTDFAVELSGVFGRASRMCLLATGGTTDSFGPPLQSVTNGLGFAPHANGVLYDSEAQRRPILHSLVSDGMLPAAYATDDGDGLLCHGIDFVESIGENASAGADFIETPDGATVEAALDVRRL